MIISIEQIFYMLDENTILKKVDHPIDEVLINYSYSVSEEASQKELVSIIGGYIKKLQCKGILIPIAADELSEVLSFLENHNSDEGSLGYERALYDIKQYGKEGISTVLEDISKSLKIELRSQYLNWIYNTKIIYLDWNLKLNLVKEFSKRYEIFLPSEITSMPDERKALFIKELLVNNFHVAKTGKEIQQTKLFN